MIAGQNSFAHTNPMFARLKILKINDIYKFAIAQYMFHNVGYFGDRRNNPYTTRNANQIAPLHQRLALSHGSLNYIGPQIWNSLPDNIRNVTCLCLFKGKTKKYLIESYLPPN